MNQNYAAIEAHYQEFNRTYSNENQNVIQYALQLNDKKIYDLSKNQINSLTKTDIQIELNNQNIIIPAHSSLLTYAILINSSMKETILDDINKKCQNQEAIDYGYTELDAITIKNDFEFLNVLIDQYPQFLNLLLSNEAKRKRSVVTLACYYNNQQMIQFLIKQQNLNLLKSLNKYIDMQLAPYNELLCTQQQFEKNCSTIMQEISRIEIEGPKRQDSSSNKKTKSIIHQRSDSKSFNKKISTVKSDYIRK